jgi:hypothetical protein
MAETPSRRDTTLASARLWLHPRVGWELAILYGRRFRLLAEYLLNRAHGIPTPEVEPGMLDPRWPLRDVRRRFGCGQRAS